MSATAVKVAVKAAVNVVKAVGGDENAQKKVGMVIVAIFMALILLVSTIFFLPAIIFTAIGFSTANSYNATFSQRAVNDLTKEQVRNYFGTAPLSDAKDENGNYIDKRYLMHEAISIQFYNAVTGTGHLASTDNDDTAQAVQASQDHAAHHLTANINHGWTLPDEENRIEWASTDGIENYLNEYKTYIKQSKYVDDSHITYSVNFENGAEDVYGSRIQSTWNRKDINTYQGLARTNYNNNYWSSGEYVNAIYELCQAHLSVEELLEIENYDGGDKPKEEVMCRKLKNAILDLDTAEVFGAGAFSHEVIQEPTQDVIKRALAMSTNSAWFDVKLRITDYYMPFTFIKYSNNAAQEAEYKNVTDEEMLNLSVSMLQNMENFKKDSRGDGRPTIWTSIGGYIRAVATGNYQEANDYASQVKATFGGKEIGAQIGSINDKVDPNFDLDRFNEWYSNGTNGYTQGYREFINVRYPSVSSTGMTNSVQDYVYMRLRNDGNLDHNTACGLMGNIEKESGFNTTSLDSSSGAFGLVCWLGNRKAALNQLADSTGRDVNSAEVQMDFLISEIQGSYGSCFEKAASYGNVDDATVVICHEFEMGAGNKMEDYIPSGVVVSTPHFNLVGNGRNCPRNDFHIPQRIEAAENFSAAYSSYALMPNGTIRMGGVQQIAADYCVAHIGDRYDQGNRMGEGVYDCSSLVSRAYTEAGVVGMVNNGHALTTSGLWNYFENNGIIIPYDENYVPQVGDVYFYGKGSGAAGTSHVDMYVGDRGDYCIVGASSPTTGVITKQQPQKSNPNADGRYVMGVGRLMV